MTVHWRNYVPSIAEDRHDPQKKLFMPMNAKVKKSKS
jgi:hypothetical protein